jgi:hypothetical protein
MLCIPRFARSTVSRIHHQYITPPQQLYWQHHFTKYIPPIIGQVGPHHFMWTLFGKIHRVQEGANAGPAYILPDSSKLWIRRGKLHRIQEGPYAGPAISWHNSRYEYVSQSLSYCKIHVFLSEQWDRDQITWYDDLRFDRQEWWLNGQLHRIDGPAITCQNGSQYWCQYNQLHRTNGPASVEPNIQYHTYDKKLTTIAWYFNGKKHRIDGPAYYKHFDDDNKLLEEWYIDGQLHREDGPASIEYNENGMIYCKNWCYNGEMHREDGPAFIEYTYDGTIEEEAWFNHGTEIDNVPSINHDTSPIHST